MGKISSLPDAERMAIIGYLAQEGVIREITAEVPLRRCDEFQNKYGVKPYVIRSDKKYSDQLRIYLSDPDDAPPLLRAALDTKYQRLNDSEFVRELVDNYGFTFFGKQDSRLITEKARALSPTSLGAFLDGYNTNNDSYDHAGQLDKDGMRKVMSVIEVLPPESVCSETYLVAGAFDTEEEAKNLQMYFCTKFVRFLVAQIAVSQHITKGCFAFVPFQDFTKSWTDAELYQKYGLSNDEITFIESMIRPMDKECDENGN